MQQTVQESPHQKKILLVLALTQIFGTVGVGLAPSIGILLVSHVTHNEAFAGLARTASTFGAALFGLPLAQLATRKGRRWALSCGWWVAAAGAAMLVYASQASVLIPLILGLLLMGAGSAASYQARFAAADRATPAKRARALSSIVWVGTVGSVLGPNMAVVGKPLGQAIGLNLYAASFLIAAVAMTLAGGVVASLLRPEPLQGLGKTAQKKKTGGFSLSRLRQEKPAYRTALALFCAHIVMVTIMTMTPVHMEHRGSTITLIGITISIHVLGMYAFSPLVGMLADRIGQVRTIHLGTAILALALLLCLFLATSQVAMVAALFLLGLGWSCVFVSASSRFGQLLPEDIRTQSQGVLDTLINLGAATAALGSGLVMAVSSFQTLAMICAVLLIPLLRVGRR